LADEASTTGLADPRIQAELLADAMLAASVGILVWDEHRRYVAANDCACQILGTSRSELLGQVVGGHTDNADELVDEALRAGFSYGTALVERFDGSGKARVFYATFMTRTAGMPYMATLLARLPD
jgi:PAS domain-containing protein